MAENTDPIANLFANERTREDALGNAAIQRMFAGNERDFTTSTAPEVPVSDAPTTFQQTVELGLDAGVAGLQSSGQYFRAITGAIVDDEKLIADSINKAARYDQAASEALASTGEFSEFWNAPTFEGGIEQVGLALGQVAPTAITTIVSALASGGTSVLAQLAGKGAIAGAKKYATRRVVREAVENVVNDVATPDEKTLVNELFKTFKRGATAGAFGSSFVPLSGQNFSEGLQSGREPDADLAIRSLLVATPQAAVDVLGETLLLKSFANTVKRKAADAKGSILGELASTVAKSVGRGAVTEGVSEGTQEAIAVANRMDMDENYTAQEGQMRIAQGIFMGAVGGAGMGGAGGVASGGYNATARIFDKAKGYLDQGRQQQTDQRIDEEVYGDTATGYTTEEPMADINAQFDAMFDPNSSKKAVWIAGEISDAYRQVIPEDNTLYQIELKGKRAVAAHVPGRGVIVGPQAIVDAVVQAGATDEALQTALGYSNTKPQDGEIVVQALDAQGRIVSEEVTNKEGLAAAMTAAEGLSPVNSVRKVSLKDALADRKRRLDEERGPTIRGMDVSTDGDTQGEFESDVIESTTYQPRNTSRDTEGGFENTAQVRDEFTSVFGDEMDIDFNLPFYNNMSESLMKSAVKLKNDNPTEFVSVTINPDLTYQLRLESTPETETVTIQDYRTSKTETISSPSEGAVEVPATVRQVPVTKFLAETIQTAKNSQFADEGAVLITPDGQSIPVNMADLTNAGKRLAEARDRGNFQEGGPVQSAKRGILAILSELASRNYDLQIDGASALQNINALRRSNIVVDTTGKNKITARDVFIKGRAETKPGPRRRETDVMPPFDNKDGYYSVFQVRDGLGMVLETLDTFEEAQQARDNIIDRLPEGQKDIGLEIVPIENKDFIEQGAESDLGSETEVMAESSFPGEDPRDGLPLSRLNLEMDPKYQSRARGGRPGRTSPFAEATYPAGSIGGLAQQVLNRAISKLRLGRPVSVFGVRELSGMSVGDIRAMFNDDRVANAVIQQLAELRDNPNARGRYIGFGDAHFILVDNRTGSELETALTASHELGHALLEEERNATLANKSLLARMQRAFDKAKNADGAPEAYHGELGFEEWYADQVAIWAQRNYLNQKRNAKGVVESHFKKLAQRIVDMFKAMSAEMRRRFGKQNYDQQFDTYIDTVVNTSRRNRQAAYQRSAARDATYEQKAIVRDLNAAMPNRALEAANRIKQQVLRAIRNPRVADAFKFIRTADGILRSVSPEIANMFYTLAQGRGQGSNIGFLRASTVSLNRFMNRVENILGTDWDTQEVRDALTLAASDAPTASLTGDDPTTVKARQIRNFLEEVYDTYIKPTPGNTIAKRENYWPVALDLQKIYTDPEAFIELIKKYDPNASEESIRRTVDGLVAMQQHILDDGEITIEGINPAGHVENARKLTDLVPQNELKNFTLPPNEALTRYLKHIVKRIEFNKATRDSEGNDILGPAIGKLSPENRAKAKQIIDVYLGYNTDPLSPLFKTVNSWGQFIQMVTLLPLATLSSLPELAGAVINAKEFGAVTMAFKEIIRTVKNRQEAMELARDIGVSASNTMSNIFMNEADAEFLDANARKLSDAFFKYIGLNFFARFTREFASNMGVSFILSHAHNKSNNPRSSRYLADLGLTADEVKAWERNGRAFTNETGEKVRSALQKFVESSMLRPNAAERPIWASDPRWALVWQLKGYFYSFGKVTLGGIKREMTARTAESGGNATAALTGIGALMALTAVAYLPLAMLGLELREYAKYGIAWVLPGVDADANRYFKSDRMDWAAYTNEMFDRAGLFGPAALLTMAGQQAEWGQSAFASLLGPSAETVEDVFREGWEVVPNRLLPVYSLVY